MTFGTVLYVTIAVLFQMVQTVSMGVLLGIGFWIAKQITNYLDEKRVLADKNFMAELQNMTQTVPAV